MISLDQLQSTLDQLAQPGSLAQPQNIAGSEGEVHWDVRLSNVDQWGCEIDQLTLTYPTPVGHAKQVSQKIAGRMCEKVNYLLEPLELLEIDEQGQFAVVRSSRVSESESVRRYYEAIVEADRLKFRRYGSRVSEVREPESCTFTREVLGRMLRDLVDAVNLPADT